MTKEQQNKAQGQYYLIKDYVVGFTYIADEKSTNILFGGMKEERLLNLDYLTTMGLSQKLVYGSKEQNTILVVRDSHIYNKKGNTQALKRAIMNYYVEESQGLKPQTREKTPDEIENATPIRLVGISKTLKQAIDDYEKIRENLEQNGTKEIEEKERVFIKYPHSTTPKNFGGKVVKTNNTTREFI